MFEPTLLWFWPPGCWGAGNRCGGRLWCHRWTPVELYLGSAGRKGPRRASWLWCTPPEIHVQCRMQKHFLLLLFLNTITIFAITLVQLMKIFIHSIWRNTVSTIHSAICYGWNSVVIAFTQPMMSYWIMYTKAMNANWGDINNCCTFF